MQNKITHTTQLTTCLAIIFIMSLLSSALNIDTLRNIAWVLIGVIFTVNPTMTQAMQVKYGEGSGKMIMRFSSIILILIGCGF